MRSAFLADGSEYRAIIVAATAPFDATTWDDHRRNRGDSGELVADIDAYLDGALVLTDEFAPVDQLIAGRR